MHRPCQTFTLKFSATCILTFGLIVSFTLFVWVYRQEQYNERVAFERRAQFRVALVRQGMTDALEALRVVNQLFVTNGEVSQEQFHSFTQPLQMRYPYIEAFGFHRLVSQVDRAAFEGRMHTRSPGFTIDDMVDGKRVAAPIKSSYRIVEFIEPMAGNEAVFILDASSLPYQHDAIARAEDTGLPSATGLFRFFRPAGEKSGFHIMMAVYKKGVQHDDVASRRLAVMGYTTAMLRADDLFEKIFTSPSIASSPSDKANAGLNVSVYAASSADDSKRVYGPVQENNLASEGGGRVWLLGPHITPFSSSIDIAGTTWFMLISAQPTLFMTSHTGTLLSLIMGLIATFAATAYLQSSTVRAQRIQQLIGQRTDELKRVNHLLIDDIKARKRAEEDLQESRSTLRKLVDHQESIKEEERKRIAREIHDDLGGVLTGIKANVSVSIARAERAGQSADPLLIDAADQVDTAIETVRRVISDLRPSVLDQLGVWAALEWQAEQLEQRTGLRCLCSISESAAMVDLDSERSTMLFRVVQESLTNVVRHARATQVKIGVLRHKNAIIVDIRDDGCGLDPQQLLKGEAWGILGMHERTRHFGGELKISGAAGKGTAVLLRLPLE
ncbi:CHASE domain-containing protein [Glaciimonas sp. GG7]